MSSSFLPLQVRLLRPGAGPGVSHGIAVVLALGIAIQIASQRTPDPKTCDRVGRVSTGKIDPNSVDGVTAEFPGERDAILDLVREHRLSWEDSRHRELADTVYYEARAADVDPLMVASIVARESSFQSRAVSHVGAVGLMQLRPFVARDVARGADMEWNGIETLHDPEKNLKLGILYYKQLVERFDGDSHKALTAYNVGPTRVSRDVRQGDYRGSRYADRVIALYDELSTRIQEPAELEQIF